MNTMQDDRTKRILVVGVLLIILCIVCIFISIRFAEKYRNKVAETVSLQQRLDNLEQEIKRLDIKTKELEAIRFNLSLDKEQISRDFLTIKDKYVSLANLIKTLELDIKGLQEALNVDGRGATASLGDDKGIDAWAQINELKSRNKDLLRKLTVKTKEKMILKIALESQAKRLGLAEQYNPELKEILKNLVTSLQ